MPRKSGGAMGRAGTKRSAGRSTRRLHTSKNTYAAKQALGMPEYWLNGGGVAREPRHRMPGPLGRPTAGRKNKPTQKPQQSKGAKGGSKGGKTGSKR